MVPEGLPLSRCAQVAQRLDIDLLLLFGSRARGDARTDSDWDFAASGADASRLDALSAELTLLLRTDEVDLVDLDRAGGLVRFHAARDGVLVHEARAGLHRAFQLRATHFWCENAALFAREYREVLARLSP